jgi:hypothetical protein
VYAAFLAVIYWITTFVWLVLAVIFAGRYLKSRSVTMLALTIACFIVAFETGYYCVMVNAKYHFLPHALYPVLSAPFMWMIPKLALVFAALAIYLAIWRGK